MKIPIFRLEFSEQFKTAFANGCVSILEGHAMANGPRVREFERVFADFISCPEAVAVGSGTDAIEIALRAIGVEGRDVIIPTNTFIATAIAVERAGGRVVLADIESETLSLDPDELRRLISARTAAIVIVHIGGIISKHVAEIVAICRESGIALIEDAAHAHGSRRGEWTAGTIGAVGCFSFFPTKVMTSGEGGMNTTTDVELAAVMRSIRDFGRHPDDSQICIRQGGNAKLTEFQALLGVLETSRVRERIDRRAHLARIYADRLKDSTYQVFMPQGQDVNSFYKVIVGIPGGQAELREYCLGKGISLTGEVYRYPVHRQPVYGHLANRDFPVADAFAANHICPPLYPELTDEEAFYVCDALMQAQSSLAPAATQRWA
jgi:perosamine synthetase